MDRFRADSALILFAHGARDLAWAAPFEAIRQCLLMRDPALRVELAFLELMQPSLEMSVDLLVQEGVAEVVIVPVFMSQSGHVIRDLPTLTKRLQEKYSDCSIRSVSSVGEAPEIIEAIADYALKSL